MFCLDFRQMESLFFSLRLNPFLLCDPLLEQSTCDIIPLTSIVDVSKALWTLLALKPVRASFIFGYLTLPLTIWLSLPTHNFLSMFNQCFFICTLCHAVSRLIFCFNMMHRHLFAINAVSEMVQFVVQMFCSWTTFVCSSNFNCTSVVFEHFATNVWFC